MASRGPEGLVLQRHGDRGQTLLSGLFTLDDVDYLAGDVGRAALDDVGRYPLTDTSRVTDIALARKRFGDRAAVLVETTLLRRRATEKFAAAEEWLFTDEALQQATTAAVAEHRALRLAGAVVHDVTCSIGGELAVLRHSAAHVVGSDVDPVRLAMARHNLGDVDLCRADALAPVTRGTVVVADPGRRTGGTRRFDPRAYTPPLNRLFEVYAGRDMVVKCAPGIDFAKVRELGWSGEIEITSLAGGVREACLWTGGLAAAGVRRRATILDRDEHVTDADPDDCGAGPPGRWIVDPDGAVVRAGLVRQYAARHGLWQLDPEIAYLTGDELPTGVRGFEIIETVDYRERALRHAVAALDAGSLEILARGVDVDPDALRTRLRPKGSKRRALVITRIGAGRAARAVAYICRPSR